MGMDAVIARARAVLGDGPTYVSFDIDSVDPGFAPGTGTPEIGGLMPREVLQILRGMEGLNFVGGDVVEVAPQYDSTTNTAHVAAQVLFTLLCLLTIRRRADRRRSIAARQATAPSVRDGICVALGGMCRLITSRHTAVPEHRESEHVQVAARSGSRNHGPSREGGQHGAQPAEGKRPSRCRSPGSPWDR